MALAAGFCDLFPNAAGCLEDTPATPTPPPVGPPRPLVPVPTTSSRSSIITSARVIRPIVASSSDVPPSSEEEPTTLVSSIVVSSTSSSTPIPIPVVPSTTRSLAPTTMRTSVRPLSVRPLSSTTASVAPLASAQSTTTKEGSSHTGMIVGSVFAVLIGGCVLVLVGFWLNNKRKTIAKNDEILRCGRLEPFSFDEKSDVKGSPTSFNSDNKSPEMSTVSVMTRNQDWQPMPEPSVDPAETWRSAMVRQSILSAQSAPPAHVRAQHMSMLPVPHVSPSRHHSFDPGSLPTTPLGTSPYSNNPLASIALDSVPLSPVTPATPYPMTPVSSVPSSNHHLSFPMPPMPALTSVGLPSNPRPLPSTEEIAAPPALPPKASNNDPSPRLPEMRQSLVRPAFEPRPSEDAYGGIMSAMTGEDDEPSKK